MNPFQFHTGIEYEQSGEQWHGTCPFCEKDKFYFVDDKWLWDCKNKNCTFEGNNRSGNLISFLRQMYAEHETATKAAQLVGAWRGLPQGRVAALGLRHNPWNDSVLIPTTKNGKINNIYKAVEHDGKVRIMATPTIEHTLFNFPEDANETVWVCEGHWDRIAAEAFGYHTDITFTAVPGAGVWKKSWLDVLADRHVVFCYDNDNSGKAGFEKVIVKHISGHPRKPKSISFIDWSKAEEPVKDGYDLNDCYIDHGKKAIDFIEPLITEFDAPEGKVVVSSTIETVQANKEIDTYDKLMDVVKEVYYVTPDMESAMLATLTSIYSVIIGGEQLWLRVIGPPGCGKTTIAKVVSASDQVVLKSTFTGLFSGWHDDSNEDASMIPQIAGKTLVVKDADALLKQPNVERIFSELRDFYDKDSSTQFKNRVAHDYRNISSTMILCGTNVLRRSDQSFLGERYLDLEMRLTRQDEDHITNKMLEKSMALAHDPSNLPPETPVQAACKGFIEHLMERKMDYHISPEDGREIKELAKTTALMRTKVDRDTYGKGDITFAPISEVPTRLIGQFSKLVHCVPIVAGKHHSDKAMKLLRKMVRDIINPTSFRYKLCADLCEGWFSRDQLVESSKIAKSTVTREIGDLMALRLVDVRKGAGRAHNAKVLQFTLNDEMKERFLDIDRAE